MAAPAPVAAAAAEARAAHAATPPAAAKSLLAIRPAVHAPAPAPRFNLTKARRASKPKRKS